MKALKVYENAILKVEDVKEPIVGDNEVKIQVKACGVCGSDIPRIFNHSAHYYPITLGHEFAGVITDNGNNEAFKIGDRVTALPISPCGKCEACRNGDVQFCPHTWEEAVGLSLNNPGGLTNMIAIRSDMVIKVPDGVADEEMAMVEPMAVGLHAAHLGRIAVGDDVLIIGGGIIGLASAMFAKKEGAQYVALTETNEARGEKSVSLGVADEWFNATSEDLVSKLMEKTNGGFDVVIECVGNGAAVNSALSLVKPGGIVVLVGVATDAVPTYTVMAVMKELVVQGAIAYTYNEFKSCIDLIARKQVDVLKFVDDIVPLERVQEAYERLTSGTDAAVKILVDPKK